MPKYSRVGVECKFHSKIGRSALGVGRFPQSARRCLSVAKSVTILCLPCLRQGLHIVCPTGQPRCYLLLTGIHRFLAPLFTSIRIVFELSPSLTAMIQL